LHGNIEADHFDARGRKNEADRRFGKDCFCLAASLEERSDGPPYHPGDAKPESDHQGQNFSRVRLVVQA